MKLPVLSYNYGPFLNLLQLYDKLYAIDKICKTNTFVFKNNAKFI